MSIFGDLDIASAADNPFDVKPGTYKATVTKAEAKPTQAGDKTGLNIEYTISDEDDATDMHGRKVSEWKWIPSPDQARSDSKAQQAMSFLKQRMLNFGIPEDRINSVEPDDLVGIDVIVSVKKNGEYTNVTKVALDTGNSGGSKPMFS